MKNQSKVVVISECTSSNLGDQAIAQALSKILSDTCDVRLVSFSHPAVLESRELEPAVLSRGSLKRWAVRLLPAKAKARMQWYLLGGRGLYREWFNQSIKGCDVVLIGGGQLIKNNIALFTERIHAIVKIAKKHDKRWGFVGVGVDKSMNYLNWLLVKQALRGSGLILVRDELSKRRIEGSVRSSAPCSTAPDLVFGLDNPYRKASLSQRRYDFALNIMSHKAMLSDGTLQLHSDLDVSYCDFASQVIAANLSCVLFTSGCIEDLEEMRRVRSAIKDLVGIELDVFHPISSDDLMRFLADVKDVIAFRMHAGILSYVSGCNVVCANWNDKIAGVWAVIGQADRVIEMSQFLEGLWPDVAFMKLNGFDAPTDAMLQDLAKTVWTEVLSGFSHLRGRHC
jgi:polysaccharide pyruvyl transferase WcaK-like protein